MRVMIHSHPSIYLSTYLSLYPGRERAPAVRHAAPWPPARRGWRTQRHPPRPAGGDQSRHERSNLAALVTAPFVTTRTSLQHVRRVQHVRSVVPPRHQLGGRRPAVARAQPRLGMQRRGTDGTQHLGNGAACGGGTGGHGNGGGHSGGASGRLRGTMSSNTRALPAPPRVRARSCRSRP